MATIRMINSDYSFDLYSDDKLDDIMELIGNKAKIYNAIFEYQFTGCGMTGKACNPLSLIPLTC